MDDPACILHIWHDNVNAYYYLYLHLDFGFVNNVLKMMNNTTYVIWIENIEINLNIKA